MKKTRIFLAILLTAAAALVGSFALVVNAQDDVSTSSSSNSPERDSVALTIYNQGTALVQDRRTFSLSQGNNLINFTDVASSIDPTSVTFVSLTDPAGTTVLEQNYVYDLVNSSALLQRYVDETIQVTTIDGQVFRGQLLSGRSEIILRTEDGQVVVVSPDDMRDIQFPELPDGLITRPTLRWLVNSEAGGDQQVELTYLTGGINWTADYNVLLATDNSSLDLNGWVTLNNSSGTAYEDALVKLVAGDVNRVSTARGGMQPEAMAYEEAEDAVGGVAQREFNEYQLYEIGRNVTVGNNETKQVEFVSGAGVPATTYYVYDASTPYYGYGSFYTDQYFGITGVTDVQNWLEFTTDEEGGLGADLPAGRIRVYQEDIDGAALLIGENTIDHTPQGEDVSIYLGNAFDLVGERTQTEFNMISRNVIEETFEIRLRNRKDNETVQIRVPERMSRWSDWEIVSSNTDFTQTNAFSIEFRVDVPPGGETVITYTVRYTR
ncbi:MAG: DUF4139 domain-containing protein [Anaerolineae bacterium]|nr:DUF4139 domain-containing protein [Anaerolineae bacterium]